MNEKVYPVAITSKTRETIIYGLKQKLFMEKMVTIDNMKTDTLVMN